MRTLHLALLILVAVPVWAQSIYTERPPDPLAIVADVSPGSPSDGVADDTAPLQSAIDRVAETTGQGILFLPSGCYRISKTIYLWSGNIPTKEQQREVARLVMKELGLAPNDIASLQKMDWEKLNAAGNAAVRNINPPGPPFMGPGASGHPRVGWSLCVDGKIINIRSFFDDAPEISKNVPMLVGAVSEEGNHMSSHPTEEQWHANLAKAYGDEKATAIITALKKSYAEKKIQTLSYMCGGAGGLNGLSMRNNVVKMAKMKHDLNTTPAYAYYFTWQTPILEGLPGAWHTAELQFCFDNTKRCEQGTGNTPEAQALAKKMASSWATFAATGKPSIPGLAWQSTDPETNRTMVWDNECRMVNDPDGDARKIILYLTGSPVPPRSGSTQQHLFSTAPSPENQSDQAVGTR